MEDECILCGRCFAVCPQDAKVIASDMEKVRIMLQTGTVYASIAPSFAASYPGVGIDALEDALKKLGFAGAEETAVGATIVKKEYERILDEEKPNILVSSCCSSINLMLRKYYPEALFTLAPVITPMQAHCRDIDRFHRAVHFQEIRGGRRGCGRCGPDVRRVQQMAQGRRDRARQARGYKKRRSGEGVPDCWGYYRDDG